MTEQQQKHIWMNEKKNPNNKVSLAEISRDKCFYLMILFVSLFIFSMYSMTKFAGQTMTRYSVNNGHARLSDDGKYYISNADGSKTPVNEFNKIDQ